MTVGAGVGQPIDRVDGRLKITGQARYCAEFNLPGLLHAALVQSSIPAGEITGFDLARAQTMAGVVAIVTPFNALKLAVDKAGQQMVKRPLLQDKTVFYNGQTIAVVVADTLERALDAAHAVRVSYRPYSAVTRMPSDPAGQYTPRHMREKPDYSRGDAHAAFAAAAITLDATYTTPIEHHNPMEPHATIAQWQGDRLTVWTTTQAIAGARAILATMFDVSEDSVQVNCPFVGGGFGCKGNTWPPTTLAAMAAKMVGRPVKLVLSRRDMYTSNGYRACTIQHVRLGADNTGRLLALSHDGLAQNCDPEFGEFAETVGTASRMIYACPNVSITHRLLTVNAGLPTYMRAPGEASGMFALESAMDELAHRLSLDPLELRLRNYAERDEMENKPYSSKQLRECYRLGAAKFGWAQRNPQPRSNRRGRLLVGTGIATATYPAIRMEASAKVRLNADGSLLVGCATQDLGTGTYTVMTQIVADAFGVPARKVVALLGDSRLPRAPISGGSMTVASISPAIQQACEEVRRAVFALAARHGGPPDPDAFSLRDGVVSFPGGSRQISELLERAGKPYLEAQSSTGRGDGHATHSLHSFGAQFAEVEVDPELGEIRVSRYVGVFDCGRVINPKTARSQLMSGIIFGIGMALLEETETDPVTGRIVNSNLAEYLLPVNPDVPVLDVSFIEAPDPQINPLGARGVGELPMVGVAGAIANAVFHATGIRVRRVPIRIEDVLA